MWQSTVCVTFTYKIIIYTAICKGYYERWIGGIYDWKQLKWKWGVSEKPMKYEGFPRSKRAEQNLQWHCITTDPLIQNRHVSYTVFENFVENEFDIKVTLIFYDLQINYALFADSLQLKTTFLQAFFLAFSFMSHPFISDGILVSASSPSTTSARLMLCVTKNPVLIMRKIVLARTAAIHEIQLTIL